MMGRTNKWKRMAEELWANIEKKETQEKRMNFRENKQDETEKNSKICNEREIMKAGKRIKQTNK